MLMCQKDVSKVVKMLENQSIKVFLSSSLEIPVLVMIKATSGTTREFLKTCLIGSSDIEVNQKGGFSLFIY